MSNLIIIEENLISGSFDSKSENGVFSSPIVFNPNGDYGDIVEKKLYLQVGDTNYYYTNITLQGSPLELIARGNERYPQAPFKLKIKVQENQPTSSDWDTIAAGNIATFSDIGALGSSPSVGQMVGFWVRLESPANLRVGENRNILFNLSYEEKAV